MSDANDNETDGPGGRKPLTLKRNVGAGTVRQNFSRGRSRAVVVEKKRKRVIGTPTAEKPAPDAAAAAPTAKPADKAKTEDIKARARALGLSEAE